MVSDPITKSFSRRSPKFNTELSCPPLRVPQIVKIILRDQVKGVEFRTLDPLNPCPAFGGIEPYFCINYFAVSTLESEPFTCLRKFRMFRRGGDQDFSFPFLMMFD